MGNILTLFRDLLIKLDSIGARILMLDLRIVVGILSQPTLLLCLRLVISLVISRIDDGWKFLPLEFDQQDFLPQSLISILIHSFSFIF